jgi:demethylmenaquinone methyltransferase / 2-methoxy-6-polyprenyl-1,4-benzoquinol methylase
MKDFQVRRMFEDIAFSYDFQNSFLSLRRDVAWRKTLSGMLDLPEDALVLDAATGTGEIALELLRRGKAARVLGVDFSPAMLRKAKEKAARRPAGKNYFPCAGDCRDLPAPNACADAATIAFGIRNIEEKGRVLRELHRILKPGGKVLVMEFGYPTIPILGAIYRFYFNHILPPVGNFLSKTDYAYTYLAESVNAFPGDASFLAEMAEAGFTSLVVKKLTLGVARIFSGVKEP